MQKILRRVATAERVAAKRKKIKDTRYWKKERKENSEEVRQQLQLTDQEFARAKQRVREAWTLGPLAPREDVGAWAGRQGVIHEARYRSYQTLPRALRDRRCAWAGGYENLNLVVGDRVVLLEGPDKGRIGKIFEIDEDASEVYVKDLNKVCVSRLVSFLFFFFVNRKMRRSRLLTKSGCSAAMTE